MSLEKIIFDLIQQGDYAVLADNILPRCSFDANILNEKGHSLLYEMIVCPTQDAHLTLKRQACIQLLLGRSEFQQVNRPCGNGTLTAFAKALELLDGVVIDLFLNSPRVDWVHSGKVEQDRKELIVDFLARVRVPSEAALKEKIAHKKVLEAIQQDEVSVLDVLDSQYGGIDHLVNKHEISIRESLRSNLCSLNVMQYLSEKGFGSLIQFLPSKGFSFFAFPTWVPRAVFPEASPSGFSKMR